MEIDLSFTWYVRSIYLLELMTLYSEQGGIYMSRHRGCKRDTTVQQETVKQGHMLCEDVAGVSSRRGGGGSTFELEHFPNRDAHTGVNIPKTASGSSLSFTASLV